jgi:hypothetical protein
VERSVENLGDPRGSWGGPGRWLREERRGPLGSQIPWEYSADGRARLGAG